MAVIAGREFFATDLVTQASRIMFEIREIEGVSEVTDAFTSGGVIGDDGRSSLVVVELDRGLSKDEALAVATAMAGLDAFADPLLSAMALGGALVVVLATVAGLTLVPALIAVAHRHVPARGARTWVWRRPAARGRSSPAPSPS